MTLHFTDIREVISVKRSAKHGIVLETDLSLQIQKNVDLPCNFITTCLKHSCQNRLFQLLECMEQLDQPFF